MTKILLKIVIGLNKIVRKIDKIMDNHLHGASVCRKCRYINGYYARKCSNCGAKLND